MGPRTSIPPDRLIRKRGFRRVLPLGDTSPHQWRVTANRSSVSSETGTMNLVTGQRASDSLGSNHELDDRQPTRNSSQDRALLQTLYLEWAVSRVYFPLVLGFNEPYNYFERERENLPKLTEGNIRKKITVMLQKNSYTEKARKQDLVLE